MILPKTDSQVVPAKDRTFPMLSIVSLDINAQRSKNKQTYKSDRKVLINIMTMIQTHNVNIKKKKHHRKRSTKWRVDSFWML